MAAKLKLDLIVDDKGSVVVKKFGTAAQGAFNVAKTAAIGMGIGIAGATAGLYALNRVMSEAVSLANIQEKAESKLGAVIKATGEAAGFNLKQMTEMAAGLQKVTTVGDETIINGMAIIATFKNIRGEAFERTTEAALDMAHVMGTDMQSAAVMMSKALNDPIANLSAMSRAGVQFTEDQKNMIKVLWESGQQLEAQNIILQELESQFGGAAAAYRETFGGAVIAAQNALGDMKEELGFVITKNKAFVELVHIAEGLFVDWGDAIKNNRVYLQELSRDGILKVAGAIGVVLETMRAFQNGWGGIRLAGQMAVDGLALGLRGLSEVIRVVYWPLKKLFDGLVLLGQMDKNPFDTLREGAIKFQESSADVREQIVADAYKTNMAYDSVSAKITAMKTAIDAVSIVEQKEAKETASTVDKAEKDKTKSKEKYFDTWRDHHEDTSNYILALTKDEVAMIAKMDKELSDDKLEIAERGIKKIVAADSGMWKAIKASGDAGTKAMYSSFSGFINPLEDDFLNLKRLWDEVTTSMVDAFADAIAQMAVDWAVTEGWKFLTSSSGGGGILDTVLSWFGTGAWNVDKDQVAGLHAGEMVLPKNVAEAIRNSGEASRQPTTGSGAAAAGFSWGGLKDLATKGIGGMMLEDMGADSPWAKKANTITSTAVSMFSPVPFSGTAAGVIAGLLAEKAADKANVRSLEALRDLATSHYGFMGGLSALAESGGWTAAVARQAANYEDRFSGRKSGNGGYGGASPGGRSHEAAGGFGSGPGYKYGGIVSGPESGYSAKLHGTELVVSQKKDVPVKMSGGNSGTMVINLILDGKKIKKWMFDQTKNGYKMVHSRGIANV